MLRRVVMQRMAAVAATAAGAGIVAACGSPQGAAPSAAPATVGNRDVTLQWQVEMQPDQLAQVPDFQKEWRDRYPKIKVEPQHMGGGDADKIQKMLTLAAGGTPIDVVGKLTFIQPLAAPGAVLPIDDLLKRDKYDVSKYNPNWLKTFGTYGGKLYSIPYGMGGNAMVFVYNRSHFQEAGVKEPPADWKNPWTYDDYRQAAIKLTKRQGDLVTQAGTDTLGNTSFTIPLPFGGVWMKDEKTAACDSPEMIEAYTRWSDVEFKDRSTAIGPGAEGLGGAPQRFYDGKVSMYYIIGSRLPEFTDPAKSKVDWAMMPTPKGTLPASPDVDTNQVAIGSKATQEESWAYLKWLLEKARYAWFSNRLPPLQEDATAWAKENFKKVPATARVDVLIQGLGVARPNDPMRAHPKAGEISMSVQTPFWQDLQAQKVSVKDGLAEAKRKLQGILG